MSKADSHVLDQTIVDQAIHWLVRLRFNQADAQTRRTFEHWLQQRPEHQLAWQRVENLGDDFAGLPSQLARQTLAGASQGMRRRESLKLLGVLAAASGAAWLGRDHTPLPALLADLRSATGERRRVQLADGSQVQLNSDSAVDARFDAERRLLVLRRGEIIVDTAAEDGTVQSRPFWVQTRDGYLRASAGRFLVRERDDGTLLAVQKGAVAVFPGTARSAPASAIVQPGSTLLFTAGGPLPLIDNGLDPWGWSDGVISAHHMRLGDFVAELSRYRPGLLRCADEVAGLRLSGTFQLADTDQVLALVARTLPLNLDYRTRYWVTLSARS
jgi:transmembrane sensor